MKHRIIIACYILVLLLSGCVALSTSEKPQPTTTIGAPVSSLSPTPTATMLAIASSTPTPAIPVPEPPQLFSENCVTISDTLPKDTYQGILVLYQLDINLDRSVFFYDLGEKNSRLLSPLGWVSSVIGVSPDKHLFLYEYDSNTVDEYRLAVTDSTGKIVKDIDNRYENERWDYYNWQSPGAIRAVKTSNEKVFPRRCYELLQEISDGCHKLG